MNSLSSNAPQLHPPRGISAGQTLLWFAAGVAGMFLLVSAIFAVKLAMQGQLPFTTTASAPRPAATATPPASAATPPIPAAGTAAAPGGNDFESGSDGILPPEAAHLSKVSIAATPAPVQTAAPTQAATTAAMPVATASTAVAARGADPAIGRQLQAWAEAWEGKAIDDYLQHYASDFQPAGKLSHPDWLAQRRQRLARPGTISVEISELDIRQSGDTASARFVQTYRASGQTLTDRKTLELVRRDGKWLILREYTAG